MYLYDRNVSLYFIKHDGRGGLQENLDVTDSIVSIGEKSWSIGNDLVKVNPSTLTFRLFDQTDSIYNWLVSNLPQGDGLVPPYVVLEVDGNTTFFGTVNPENIKRVSDVKQDFLDFDCQDWSRLLADADPTEILRRPLPKIVDPTGTARPEKSKSGYSPAWIQIWAWLNQEAFDSLGVAYFEQAEDDWLFPGDKVSCLEVPGIYNVVSVYKETNLAGTSFRYVAHLDSFIWPYHEFTLETRGHVSTFTFVRQPASTIATKFIMAKETIDPDADDSQEKVYVLKVNTVNGIYPGDKLDHITQKSINSYVIRDIDSENNKIIFTDAVSSKVTYGDLFELSEESYNCAIFEPFKKVVNLAAAIISGGVDFTRFTPHVFSRPFLSWLPFRGPVGEIISAPNDLQVSLTGIVLKGPDLQYWNGLPETGYTKQATWVDYADWTQQLTTAPASLMPLDKTTYPTYALRENKPRSFWDIWNFDWSSLLGGETGNNDTPSGYFVYDYVSMKRYEVTNTTVVTTTGDIFNEVDTTSYSSDIHSQTWNGSAWGTRNLEVSLSGENSVPLCGVVFPAVPNSLLVVQKGGNLTLLLGAFAGTSISLPPGLEGGVLVRTPYGIYILGASGAYGKVTWVASALKLDYFLPQVRLPNNQILKEFRFFETTLTALDESTLCILANIKYVKDTMADIPEYQDEVWLFHLDPNAAEPPSVQPEKIADGSYSTARTVRDPSGARIFGLLGGRLYQIATTVTDTFERFTPSDSALELIEQLCIAQNAICQPGEGPTIQIISRNVSEVALPVNLEIKSETINRTSNFFSQFQVSGSGDGTSWYWVPSSANDANHELSTIQRGGKNFELSCNDYVTTVSQCGSLAADYADFFGKPRMGREIEVISSGYGAAVYESFKPLQRIIINDETIEWHVMGVSYSLTDAKAKIKLLQAY